MNIHFARSISVTFDHHGAKVRVEHSVIPVRGMA
jgi:hypothetical protein